MLPKADIFVNNVRDAVIMPQFKVNPGVPLSSGQKCPDRRFERTGLSSSRIYFLNFITTCLIEPTLDVVVDK